MKITYTDTMHVVDKTLTNGIMTHDNQSQILSIVFFWRKWENMNDGITIMFTYIYP